MRSQVTTKRGDAGTTTTIAGDTYSKSHPILECCGHVDSLRAHTALCRQLLLESDRLDKDKLAEVLLWLSHCFFLIGSQCNDPLNKHPEYRKLDLSGDHLDQLEQWQAALEHEVRIPRQFIVAASNVLAAQLDIACTVTRQLERNVVRLKEAVAEFDADTIIAFLNRLSDYFFLLARKVEDGHFTTVDYDVFKQ